MTTGQNVAGQKRDIQRWLDGNGIDAASVRWFIDKSSGDNLERPAFEELQSAVFGGEVGTIVVWKLDRVSKMVAALLFAVAEMEEEHRRERQRSGIEAARERGVYRGRQKGTTKAKPARARELQSRGLTVNEIAQSLGISRRTAHRYLATASG